MAVTKSSSRASRLDGHAFFFFFTLLRPSAGAFVVVHWHLLFASFMAEESTDRLLSCSIVRHHIHQLVDGLRAVSTQLPHQVFAGGA